MENQLLRAPIINSVGKRNSMQVDEGRNACLDIKMKKRAPQLGGGRRACLVTLDLGSTPS